MKVRLCSRCKYFEEGISHNREYERCNHLQNTFLTSTYKNYYKEYLAQPQEMNEKNQCARYKQTWYWKLVGFLFEKRDRFG